MGTSWQHPQRGGSICSLLTLPCETCREECHSPLDGFQKPGPLLPGMCLLISNLSTLHCYSICISCLGCPIPISAAQCQHVKLTVLTPAALPCIPSPVPPATIPTTLTTTPCSLPFPLVQLCASSQVRVSGAKWGMHFSLSKRGMT